MILSVSRRTDIPSYYSDWFYNRVKAGYLYVRNPMNVHQISEIRISPQLVDGIVFWTKNPAPMLERLEEIREYPYYFQFTLTGYGKDVERSLPDKKKVLIPVFQELSRRIGRERVIWRYDPILFTDRYSMAYHCKAFEEIAKALAGYTNRCVISFVDIYEKNRKSLLQLGASEPTEEEMRRFASQLSEIARANHLSLATCAEKIDLSEYGIGHSRCVDGDLLEQLAGRKLTTKKDKNQRPECGCAESIDVGAYDTCRNGCVYCYANNGPAVIQRNCGKYDSHSPLLCSQVMPEDRITRKEMKSLREEQLSLLDCKLGNKLSNCHY